jgi:hypothetical protein
MVHVSELGQNLKGRPNAICRRPFLAVQVWEIGSFWEVLAAPMQFARARIASLSSSKSECHVSVSMLTRLHVMVQASTGENNRLVEKIRAKGPLCAVCSV